MSAQKTKSFLLLSPRATNANPASAYIDCSLGAKVKIVCSVTKGNAALTAFTLEEATTNAGGGLRNLARNVPVWVNLNSGASTAQVRQANGVTYALDNANDGRGQLVIFEVETAKLGTGFRFLRVQTAAGDAANIASIAAEVELRDSVA